MRRDVTYYLSHNTQHTMLNTVMQYETAIQCILWPYMLLEGQHKNWSLPAHVIGVLVTCVGGEETEWGQTGETGLREAILLVQETHCGVRGF